MVKFIKAQQLMNNHLHLLSNAGAQHSYPSWKPICYIVGAK